MVLVCKFSCYGRFIAQKREGFFLYLRQDITSAAQDRMLRFLNLMTSAVSIILECFGNIDEQFVPEACGSMGFGCVFLVSWLASMGIDLGKKKGCLWPAHPKLNRMTWWYFYPLWLCLLDMQSLADFPCQFLYSDS